MKRLIFAREVTDKAPDIPATANFVLSVTPMFTLPPSVTENTSLEPSYKFRISPLPLCVIAAPTVELFAATSSLSTSVNTVSNVVVVPLTVRLPVSVASPVTLIPELVVSNFFVPL